MTQTAAAPQTAIKELKTAARHTAMYGLGSILAKAMGFLMIPFYTRHLSPSDYGILEILDLSMSLFAMVLHMGLAPAVLRSYAAAASDAERKRTISTAFLFVGATGLCTLLCGISIMRPISSALLGPAVSSHYLLLSFLGFIFSYLTSMPRTYLRALEKSGTLTTIESASLFAMLVLNVYFIAVLKIGVAGILWSAVLVNGIQMAIFTIWIVKKVGIAFSYAGLRDMTSFGLPLILSNVSLFALNFSDRFFLQRLQSLDVVGIYSVGYKFAFMVNFLLVQPFFTMWQTRMFIIYRQPDHARIFRQIFMLYSFVLIYTALGLAVLSPEVIALLASRNFAASQYVVPVVSLAYVFFGIGYYLQLGMFLRSRTRAIGVVGIGAAVLNLVLNDVLIRKFGMMGAAWATLLGFVAIAAGSHWFSQRVLPMKLGTGRVLTAIVAAVLFYVGCLQIPAYSLVASALIKTVVLLAFPVVLWMLRILTPAELGIAADGVSIPGGTLVRRLGWMLGW